MPPSFSRLLTVWPWLRRGSVWRFAGAIALAGTLVVAGRSSKAEFEFPSLDTTTAPLVDVEFRGLFSFNRGTNINVMTPNQVINRYEAYAVGVNPSPGCSPIEDCNGILYSFDGTTWKHVASPFTAAAGLVYSLNAIAGQDNIGTPTPLFAAGSNGRIAWIRDYYATLGDATTSYNSQFAADTVTGIGSPEKRDFYTIGAAQGYNQSAMAGGQKGLVATTYSRSDGSYPRWDVINPVVTNDGNRSIGSETVTAIRYANFNDIYILTSVFPGDPNDLDGVGAQLPTSPFKHVCNGASTTYLYKATYANGYAGMNQWTKLASISGTCGYDLTVGTPSSSPYTNGPIQHVMWIAADNGAYTYDEGTLSLTAPPAGSAPVYAITAAPNRGGQGINLLNNGYFDNHVTSATTSLPDGWLFYNRWYGKGYNGAGACASNSTDYSMVAGQDGKPNSAVQIWTSPTYFDAACTASKFDPYYTEGFTQSIPLSTIEGQTFRITGWYKVNFPANTGAPAAKAPQGGVAIGCNGGQNNGIQINSSGVPKAGSVDCSFSNRKYISVGAQGDPSTGWKRIDLTMSREDLLFSSINVSQDNTGKVTPRRMFLAVRCEATYGAQVTCDDLRVEEVNTPPTPARDTYTVMAAGPNLAVNGFLVNADALHSSTFTREAIPSKVTDDYLGNVRLYNVNALTSVGLQHVFAAGLGQVLPLGSPPVLTGVQLFSRTPSTLAGSIWLGATSPTSAGTNPWATTAVAGNISISCLEANGSGIRPTLCQSSPESYGLSLEITSAANQTKTGRLSGSAWYGKPTTNLEDTESLNLGKCLRSPLAASGGSDSTYSLAGVCDYTVGTGGPPPTSGNAGSRRCFSGQSHTIGVSPVTTNSCIDDFDCFGRCERDEGFLCITDSDCQVTSGQCMGGTNPGAACTSDAQCSGGNTCRKASNISTSAVAGSTGSLAQTPASRLTCGAPNASPLACRPTGWLTLNAKDLTNASPPSGAFGVTYNTLLATHNSGYQNPGAHELSGWGRFMSLTSPADRFDPKTTADGGWVRFRGDPISPVALSAPVKSGGGTQAVLFGCRNCTGAAPGSMNCAFCQDAANHSCVPSDTSATAACFNVCRGDPSIHCSSNPACGAAGPCIAPGYCSNPDGSSTATACYADSDCTTAGSHCVTGALCSPTGSQCTTYGVNLDTETNQFRGYAWNENFGWLDFQSVRYSTSRIIQTKLGDIYARGQIGQAGLAQPAAGVSCNSTYLITSASTITGFCSTLGDTSQGISSRQQFATIIPSVSSENSYQNILGRFDLTGMEQDLTPAGPNHYNKYGATVVPLTPNGTDIGAPWDTAMGSPNVLGGKVYTVGSANGTQNYTLDAAIPLANSSNLTTLGSGAGILIINGNLLINQPISYTSAPLAGGDFRLLASLTIVVRGSLTINNSVTNLVGAYYVTDLASPSLGIQPPGAGTLSTTYDLSGVQVPLTINGLVIAKNIKFLRKYAGTTDSPAPSEIIVYDGRLQSNPLPGMTDFASGLPNTVKAGP